jgi:hypothetical protein
VTSERQLPFSDSSAFPLADRRKLTWRRWRIGPAFEPLIEEARDRQRRRRRRLILTVFVLAAAVAAAYGGFRLSGGGGGLGGPGVSAAAPAELPRQPLWFVGQAPVPQAGCSRCVQTASWASTIPYEDSPNDFPVQTMLALGPHDAIVMITRGWQPQAGQGPLRWMRTRRPLRIVRSQIHSGFEGNPTRDHVSQWETATWRNGSFVTVYVFFGSPHPPPSDVANAERELAGTRFPTWKIRR